MLINKKNVHFVGIGGIGMSAIALILLKKGYNVSGSDIETNNLTKKIESAGGRIFMGHDASNLPFGAEVVVYSSSIAKSNPELAEAAKRKIPVVQRAQVLGELLNNGSGIAVAGTHGKTTTTSLISVMLENCGLDPTVIIGGEVESFKGNAKSGRGPYIVAEADESDGSFLYLRPLYSVITNIEMEHMDYYKDINDVLAAYAAFAGKTKESGSIFYNSGDENTVKIMRAYKGHAEDFGFSENAAIHPVGLKMEKFNTSFGCVYKNKLLGNVGLKIPGRHNVLNSLAAMLVGLKVGIGFPEIADSIKDFKGTKRRFDLRADVDGIMLIDDYAHHPTEIKAVLDACRNWKDRRVIAVFQPHRYSRTMHLSDEFGKCFDGADVLILTDIYPASEDPISGVSVKNIFDKVRMHGIGDVTMMKKEDVVGHIMKIKKPGDIILVLGAGDIKNVTNELSERMNIS